MLRKQVLDQVQACLLLVYVLCNFSACVERQVHGALASLWILTLPA